MILSMHSPAQKTRKNNAETPFSGMNPSMIYLLRHGEIKFTTAVKRYTGWLDLPLNARGRRQARLWADYFGKTGLHKIYSSPLSRCMETARIIGRRTGLVPQAIPAFKEIHLGSWEGASIEAIKSLYPKAYRQRGNIIADYRPPAGESFRDLQDRVWPAFESVARENGEQTLVVIHAGVIRVLLCRMLGLPLEHLFRIAAPTGSVAVIEKNMNAYHVRAMNLEWRTSISEFPRS
jgi:probable phosphoglycerate mutase